MNITLSADAALISKTRRYAKAHGKTLNGMERDYMESLVGAQDCDEAADEFTRLALDAAGHSAAGFQFDRDAAHERGNA